MFSAHLPPSVLIWQGGKAGCVKTEAMVLSTDQKSQEEGITLLKPPKETELHRDDLPRTLTEERSPEVPASPEGQSTRLMGLGWLEGSVWGLCLAVQLLPSEQETCNSVLNWQHRKHWKVGPVLCRPRLEGGPRQMEGILSTHLCSPDTKHYKLQSATSVGMWQDRGLPRTLNIAFL